MIYRVVLETRLRGAWGLESAQTMDSKGGKGIIRREAAVQALSLLIL